mgnify:CR=1 FL=1
MVFLAKQMGMTKVIDGLTINISQRLLPDRAGTNVRNEEKPNEHPGDCTAPRPNSCPPTLILISQNDYRDSFNNTSPLKRETVADGLTRLFKSKPAAVMVDLDLSPSTREYEEYHDQLDGVLDEAAKREQIKLVLITPLLDEISLTTEEWLQQRCKNGVGFAFNSVASEFGIVFRYSDRYPSLGVVAKFFIPGSGAKEYSTICSLLDLQKSRQNQQSQRLEKLDQTLWDQGNNVEDLKYVRWIQTNNVVNISWDQLSHANDDKLRNWFKNRLVFVGSKYDLHDQFQSPLGPKSGVETHMAIAYSKISETHLLLYTVEIGVGAFLGALGAWCWKKHYACRSEHIQSAGSGELSWENHAWRFVCRGVLFIIPALTGLLILLVIMSISNTWLKKGVWINPVPLAIGIFLDLLVSRDHAHEVSGKSHDGSENTCLSFVWHPSLLIQIPLIFCALYLLTTELLH